MTTKGASVEGAPHTPGPWTWGWQDESMCILHGADVLLNHVLAVTPCKACSERSVRDGRIHRNYLVDANTGSHDD